MSRAHKSAIGARQAGRVDDGSLHERCVAADGTLDLLELCQEAVGGDLPYVWIVASVHPRQETAVFSPKSVPDAEIRAVLQHMRQKLRSDGITGHERLGHNRISRWGERSGHDARVDVSNYREQKLAAGGQFYGLVRATGVEVDSVDDAGWDGFGEIMQTVGPYLILALEREAQQKAIDDATGLWDPQEFGKQVDMEVERARVHPVELSLVIMELCMGPDETPGALTEQQLYAIASVITRTLRETDIATRMADGRFGLLLPRTGERNAYIAVSRLEDALRQHSELPDEMRISVGISGWTFEGAERKELFQQAATALENAKCANARGAFVFL